MATKRALSHLDALINLTERADRQITSLATTLSSIIEQMDAVTEDVDRQVCEVLSEKTAGKTKFHLSQTPVKAKSLTLYLDSKPVASDSYEMDCATGVLTFPAVLAERELRAEYTALGLASQTRELLDVIPGLDTTYFATQRAAYRTVIAWIGDFKMISR